MRYNRDSHNVKYCNNNTASYTRHQSPLHQSDSRAVTLHPSERLLCVSLTKGQQLITDTKALDSHTAVAQGNLIQE